MENNKVRFRRISYALIDKAIEEGWTKQLSYYLHISSLFGNSIIYNYSSRSLAEKMGCSKSAIHSNVNFLLKKGLLRKCNSGNLICLSKKEVKGWFLDNYGVNIGSGLLTLKIHKDLKNTEYNIFARVPLNSIKRQRHSSLKRSEVYAIRARFSNNSFISKNDLKKLRDYKFNLGNKTTENEKPFTGDNCFLSDDFLCKGTGKSINTVRNMVKFWKEEGLINSILVKGRSIGRSESFKLYSIMKEQRSQEFKNTYFYRGKIMEYNKRLVTLGDNINKSIPNSI